MNTTKQLFLLTDNNSEKIIKNLAIGTTVTINPYQDLFIITEAKDLFDVLNKYKFSEYYNVRCVNVPQNKNIFIVNKSNHQKVNTIQLGNQLDLSKLENFEYLTTKGLGMINDKSAIQWACKNGHCNIVEFLLNINPKWIPENDYEWYISMRRRIAIHTASQYNQIHIIDSIIKSRNIDDINTAISNSASGGHLEMVKKLIENYKAPIDVAFNHALFHKHLSIIKYLIEAEKNNNEKFCMIKRTCDCLNITSDIISTMSNTLFMITNRNEFYYDTFLKTGLNILSPHAINGGKKYIVTTAKFISNFFTDGYYLRQVTFPLGNTKLVIEKNNDIYYCNMINLGDRYELSNPKTYEFLNDNGFDLQQRQPKDWADQFVAEISNYESEIINVSDNIIIESVDKHDNKYVINTETDYVIKPINEQSIEHCHEMPKLSMSNLLTNLSKNIPLVHNSTYSSPNIYYDNGIPKLSYNYNIPTIEQSTNHHHNKQLNLSQKVIPNYTTNESAKLLINNEKEKLSKIYFDNLLENYVSTGNIKMLELLVENNLDMANQALTYAVKIGQYEVIEFIITIQEINVNEAMKIAFNNIDCENQNIVYNILKQKNLDLSLCSNLAAYHGNLDIVRDLIIHGQNPVKIFFKAVEGNHFDIIEYISKMRCLNTNDIKIAMTIIKGQIQEIVCSSNEVDVYQQMTIMDFLEEIMLYAT
ncbi:ankyrin repeat protein [Cotonvirus japonicus]|uniref:Ankyrin repeat protein n=1 Tax=Cotonvirus japonicus TaxID=2811091 RepID=A0ABM7NTT3_9VIRU|nr:ankyrin repeat protein [Cotonvirus japonicus]BCS83580.1 ankyrin repeat protein [Cotonvirus japonicus]